MLTNKLHSS